jgi:DNA-directed RNA polymerase specialized sigma24 family protein
VVSDGIGQWERAIVARVAVGDDSALALAYDQYAALLHGIAVHRVGPADAPAVVQQVFAELWDHPERYSDAVSLRDALATAARRRCAAISAGRGRPRPSAPPTLIAPLVAAPNVDEAFVAMVDADEVRRALAALPLVQRSSIDAADRLGLTFRELAISNGTAEASARSHVRLGLQRLGRRIRTAASEMA